MARASKVLCDRCESKIAAGGSFCPRCGHPTQWATHEERTTWELSQWKTTADRAHPPAAPPGSNGSSRRWLLRPFGRKNGEKPALTLVANEAPENGPPAEAAPAAGAKDAVADATTAAAMTAEGGPAPAPPRSEPAPATPKRPARPLRSAAPRPAMRISPGPRDEEGLENAASTVMALRLLNARMAELDTKIRRLERELEQNRPAIRLP